MPDYPRTPRRWRVLTLGYGVIAYLIFLLTVGYYIGFLANVGVPKGIDEGTSGPLVPAVVVNGGLIAAFGLQHSVMARSWFKQRWTRLVPEPIERSTFVLLASLLLLVLVWVWIPLPAVFWEISGPLAWLVWGGYGLGWMIVILSTFQISHTEFVGLQQTYAYFQERNTPTVPFQTAGFYRYVRHPLMTGLLLAFWLTPTMTVGRLLYAAGFTIYVLLGVRLEERMLLEAFGDQYRQYRLNVPRFVPRPGRAASRSGGHADTDAE